MEKIIDIKTEDWTKGISAQKYAAIGGVFQQLEGIDPFEDSGNAMPSLAPASASPVTIPKFLTNWNSGGTAYVYAHTDTALYRILRDSPYTITDVTAQIAATTEIKGAVIHKSRYIYAHGASGEIRSNTLPVASGSDVQIVTGIVGTLDYMSLCLGADQNLYYAQLSRIGKITNVTGTSGNVATAFSVGSDYTVRHMVNDGRYLVIFADSNDPLNANKQVGNYTSRVYFWDMVKGTADVIWDVPGESYLIGGAVLNDGVYFFGYKGLYVCNSATKPRMVRPLIGTNATILGKPLNPSQITTTNNSIYWVDGSGSNIRYQHIYAYGNPAGNRRIFYLPYINTGTAATNIALQVVGEQFWQVDNTPKLWIHNIGSTRGVLGIRTIDTHLPQTYKYEFTKVVLKQPLASGQTVSLQASSANGNVTVSNNETKSYSAANPKQNLIFDVMPTSGSKDTIESLTITIQTTGGAGVQRITSYGTPIGDNNEVI